MACNCTLDCCMNNSSWALPVDGGLPKHFDYVQYEVDYPAYSNKMMEPIVEQLKIQERLDYYVGEKKERYRTNRNRRATKRKTL